MPYLGFVMRPCISCERETPLNRWRRGQHRCPDCADAHAVITAVEIAAHYGDGYRAYLAGLARYVSRETSRSTEPVPDASGAGLD
jgi:hypothetical protein